MDVAIGYARITENVLAVKSGAVPGAMKGKIYPIVSEDISTGSITVLAEGRKILLEGRFVKILSDTEAEVMRRQAVPV